MTPTNVCLYSYSNICDSKCVRNDNKETIDYKIVFCYISCRYWIGEDDEEDFMPAIEYHEMIAK